MAFRGSTVPVAGLVMYLLACMACRGDCILMQRNVDTKQPVIRGSPRAADEGLFGYSLALHQLNVETDGFSDALQNTRVIVGAPKGTGDGENALRETGLVYTCPVSPGECEPFDNERLYDEEENLVMDGIQKEEKSGQFMGGALESNGDMFIACAHRYLNFGSDGEERSPLGRCFYSDRMLQDFTETQPCNGVGIRRTYSVEVCQAGTGAALAMDAEGETAIGLGAPGVFSWRGILARVDSVGQRRYSRFGHGTDLGGLQGYTVSSGNILSQTSEDFIISAPLKSFYFGAVSVIMNDRSVSVISQPLTGSQMGEYFGFSLVAADLTGDGFDEVVVGAPLYSGSFKPEAGRVFNLTVCSTYSGRGVADELVLNYSISGDAVNENLGLERRVFFDEPGYPVNLVFPVTSQKDSENCIQQTVYIFNDISDKLNGFTMEFGVAVEGFDVEPQDGNQPPVDFGMYPILVTSGESSAQVETFKDCDGLICYPDLKIQHIGTVYETDTGRLEENLLAGSVTSVDVKLRVQNLRDDAFLAVMTFVLPSVYLRYVRVEPREAFINCGSQALTNELTQYNCPIGNPLDSGSSMDLGVLLSPKDAFLGDRNFLLSFNLTSLNEEEATSIGDNSVSVELEASAIADLSIQPGTVTPDQVAYSPELPPENATLADIGPEVVTTFVITNAGPSTIPTVGLEIMWPLNSIEEGNYYLIPAAITADTTITVTCGPAEYFGLLGGEGLDNSTLGGMVEGNQDSLEPGRTGERGKRRGRGRGRERRQGESGFGFGSQRDRRAENDDQQTMQLVTIDCEEEAASCVSLQCNILNLPKNTAVALRILSHVDERFFATKMASYTLIPSARTFVANADYLQLSSNEEATRSNAQINLIPAFVPLQGGKVAGWVIAISVILALLFIAAIVAVIILVACCCYKRRKAIKEKREKLLQHEPPSNGTD